EGAGAGGRGATHPATRAATTSAREGEGVPRVSQRSNEPGIGASGGELVQELDVGARRAVDALELGVRRLDEVVLVGGVGSAAVAQAEVARAEREGSVVKEVAGPRSAEARPEDGLDPAAAVGGHLGADD